MKVGAKKAATKQTGATKPGADPVTAARESLGESTTSVRDASIATLAHIRPGLVTVDPGGIINPPGLFDRSFNDAKVGIDDSQMPAFFAAISTAINDDRVNALIQSKLANTGASANIGDIVRLIQLWVDNPDIKA